jgi:pyruvate ferredoxin oxidoreductase gamma subunit
MRRGGSRHHSAHIDADAAGVTGVASAPSAAFTLPHPERLFELRFESIGGLGAHAAAQVLASAAVLGMGLNGAHFSSYGSEKKGSLVRSFVRLGPSERPIRSSAPIERPDVLVVFHAALLGNPGTLAGLRADGVVIVNAPPGPLPDGLDALPRGASLIRIDALGIAVQEQSRPNAVLLGTLCAVLPFFDTATVRDALSDEFAGKHPEAVAANSRAFARGGAEFERFDGIGRADGDLPIAHSEPHWGYLTQAPGGIVREPGSTAWNDLSISRTGWLPVLDRERCVHCGVCDLVCPDFCLVWRDGAADAQFERELAGVDYRYCKGCMRCVESCPSRALTREAETPGLADRLRVPLFPGLVG